MLQLNIPERLAISEILPPRATLSQQLLALDIARKTELSGEERQQIELVEADEERGGRLARISRWNGAKAEALVKEIVFTSAEIDFLKSRVIALDNEKAITPRLVGLCLKIRDAT